MRTSKWQSKNQASLTVAVWLVAAYIACQIIADVTAVKMVTVFGLVCPAGSLIYAITFTVIDMIHKRLGKAVARATILAAAAMNILMAGYFWLSVQMPFPPFWGLQESYGAVLALVPRIVVASIIAEVISELVDREFYSLWIRWAMDRWQWARVVLSNAVSVPLDSVLFATLAFYGTMPLAALGSIIVGQIVLKYPVSLLALPGIYGVKEG